MEVPVKCCEFVPNTLVSCQVPVFAFSLLYPQCSPQWQPSQLHPPVLTSIAAEPVATTSAHLNGSRTSCTRQCSPQWQLSQLHPPVFTSTAAEPVAPASAHFKSSQNSCAPSAHLDGSQASCTCQCSPQQQLSLLHPSELVSSSPCPVCTCGSCHLLCLSASVGHFPSPSQLPVPRGQLPSTQGIMDQVMQFVEPSRQFVKDSIRLVKRCTKPDRKEFQKIAMATAIGFAIMGFIGFFVKLIHIPINNIIVDHLTFEDNDPKHTSRLCKGYLTKKESDGVLHKVTWPPQSPDLNPIEMVWGELDRRVKAKGPTSAKHLWELLQDCWKTIPGDCHLKLIKRMPRVCKAVIKAKGRYFEEPRHGIQGKHRVTKRGPALSYPMFTLVTSEDIAGSFYACNQGKHRWQLDLPDRNDSDTEF
ncbi:unnamed protein product [Ranitomeya imitator]|uniref:Protein transport protein Sec61 subunit gamma n=1 Tax=Ranitomeya imitator TaxID=111125 RepID=A0ABN9KT14_9NEOB|nr:unnamed protein product [Ranitomeya imitator]